MLDTRAHGSTAALASLPAGRIRVSGKFLQAGDARFRVKGVTYGTFSPDAHGSQFPPPATVDTDFALMAAHGVNTVRIYTPPPRHLLDDAAAHGLRVMVGVPWSQHVALPADRRGRRELRRGVAREVGRLADHPAAMLFAIGNEIPASVVRWHGRARTERFLHELYDECKDAAPEALLTYVNFPPTGHLDLPFVDVVSFNVYLHHEDRLRAYIAQVQHLAGRKPLLLAELGADSIRETAEGQARLTAMQLRTAFEEGACGAIAFAWTDEWWRGGFAVEDWAFGLVDAARRAKPALAAVDRTFAEAPFATERQAAWPKVSVVVCAHNAGDTLEECLTSLETLTYPSYEIVLVNDGSSDRTGDIAAAHPRVLTVTTPNNGLSAARNVGLGQAHGEIVAYTDADVRVDPDWLTYLVQPFLTSDVVGAGGPNVVPPDDGWLAQCVARAPGGPTHVLLDNVTAEHVPGCNMAFRRDALIDVGGFNTIYRRAGDDVDLCWRLQARGGRIGFAPAAMVWHHHRASIRAYWRQQVGYGEGEAWLAPHHPDRFRSGHAIWRGQIYSPLPFVRALSRAKVNTGPWGTAAFPSVYLQDAYPFAFMPHKVRWLVGALALVVIGAATWVAGAHHEGAALALVGALGLGVTLVKCLLFALDSDLADLPRIGRLPPRASRLGYRVVIAWLHFIQPFARGWGRARGMLADVELPEHAGSGTVGRVTVSRRSVGEAVALLVGRGSETQYWGEGWTDGSTFLTAVRDALQGSPTVGQVDVDDGWQHDRDISVQVAAWGWLDMRMLVEDHGSGKRLARVNRTLRCTPFGVLGIAGLSAAAVICTALDLQYRQVGLSSAVLSLAGVIVLWWGWQAARTLAAVDRLVARAAATLDMVGVRPRHALRAGAGPRGSKKAVLSADASRIDRAS